MRFWRDERLDFMRPDPIASRKWAWTFTPQLNLNNIWIVFQSLERVSSPMSASLLVFILIFSPLLAWSRPVSVSVAACQICIQLQPALEALCLTGRHTPGYQQRERTQAENVMAGRGRGFGLCHMAVTMGNGS